MGPEQRAAWMDRADEVDVDLAERALAENTAMGWRATPVTMAHHLTGGEWKLWRYSALLGEQFRSAAVGDDPNQIWMLPSQVGKTSTLTWGIVWLLDRDPTKRIMYVSYDGDRATAVGGETRDLALAFADQLRFELRPDSRAKSRWTTTQGGGLYCAGVGGGITGYPEDVIICDDLLAGWQAAHSETIRRFTWNVYRSQVRMRLQHHSDMKLMVGTRWHQDDIPARLMAAAEDDPAADQWSVVRIPAIAEAPTPESPDPLLRQPDPLGRAPGEVIEPEKFPPVEVQARAATLGSYLAAAMEQQRPSPEEGNDIKRAWFRLDEAMPDVPAEALTSWDFKLKDKEQGDFVVGQVWYRTGPDCWCVDQLRGQWNFATTVNAVALAHVRWPKATKHVMENTGNGPEVRDALRTPDDDYVLSDDIAGQLGMSDAERAAVQAVRRRGLGGIVMETPRGDKAARMRAQASYIEAGDVHLPARGQWVPAFLDEMAAFGAGASHDDQVDACSQALKYLHEHTSKPATLLGQRQAASIASKGSVTGFR